MASGSIEPSRVSGLGTWTPLDDRLTIESPDWLEEVALAALEQS